MRKLLATFLVMVTMLLTNISVYAAGNQISVTTRFPHLFVDAGESITYNINLKNDSGVGQLVEIGIKEFPKDWTYLLTVEGKQVKDVYIEAGEKIEAKVKVDVPINAKENIYQYNFFANTDDYNNELNIITEVKEIVYKENQILVDYPDLTGDAKTSFDYRLNILNNGLEDISYSLDAQMPTGWEATFTPSGSSEKVASILVEAGSNKYVNLKLKAPDFTKEDTYKIKVHAKSNDETLSKDLSVKITGSYDIKVSTPTGKLSEKLVAGEEKQIKLLIENTGGSTLKNIELSSWEPSGWETRFDEKIIKNLEPGESREIIGYVKADEKAISGDYVMTITAKTAEVSNDIEFRMTVVTSKLWGAVGILIIISLAGLLGFIMKKYGRR